MLGEPSKLCRAGFNSRVGRVDENKTQGNSEWWEFLGLDPDTPDGVQCDFKGCDRLSEWWFSALCCKEVYLMCTEHVNQTHFEIKALPEGKAIKCKFCPQLWTGPDFITVPQRLDSETHV